MEAVCESLLLVLAVPQTVALASTDSDVLQASGAVARSCGLPRSHHGTSSPLEVRLRLPHVFFPAPPLSRMGPMSPPPPPPHAADLGEKGH